MPSIKDMVTPSELHLLFTERLDGGITVEITADHVKADYVFAGIMSMISSLAQETDKSTEEVIADIMMQAAMEYARRKGAKDE